MYIDFKVTMWERVQVPEGMEDLFLNKLKEGKITSASDMWEYSLELDCEPLIDTGEQMTVEENGNCATIEAIDEKGSLKYSNAEDVV